MKSNERRRIHVGTVVQHFEHELDNKGHHYRVINFARLAGTLDNFVVYEALFPPYRTYVSPFEEFMAEVDHEKYPAVQQKYVFEKLQIGRREVSNVTDEAI